MPKASRLHFKEPPADKSEKEKRRGHKRHRSRDTTSVPHHGGYEFDDEGWVPLGHKYKVANDDDAFQQRMFDEMAADEGGDYWDNVYSVPRRWQSKSHLDDMSEHEYAKYMRRGMWEKQHEEDIRAYKELEDRRRKEQREKDRLKEEIRREEARRERDRLNVRKQRNNAKVVLSRNEYTDNWEQLIASSASSIPLLYGDFIWPTVARDGSFYPDDVHTFLTVGIDTTADKLAMLREARFRFHPDKFRQRFGKRISGSADEKRILAAVVSLSQVINQIIDTYD